MRILLVDDDTNVLDSLEVVLRREGYTVQTASDGEQAWELFATTRPDFAVLDYSMPELDGLALTRRIASAGEPRVPIILLTGRGHERDKVAALDAGADDYVVKPFSPRELLARIRAVWRRASTPAHQIVVDKLAIDTALHRFTLDGKTVDVTTIEFLLLLTLMERAGQVVRYATLMQRVWGSEVSNDLLRVTVYRLRRKIEPDPKNPRYIQTVPGVGFLIPISKAAGVQPAPV